MSSRIRQIRARLIVSAVIAIFTVALVGSDVTMRSASAFWREHAMFSAIVSGLVLFALAAFVIDWWIEYRETQKAQRVMRVAYKGLAHVMRQQGEYLHALTSGERPRRSPVVLVDEALLEDCVLEVTRIRQLHGEGDLATYLVEDERWRLASHLLVRDLRLSLAVAIAQWAAVMAQIPKLADDLNHIAGAVDTLIPLQRLLRDDRGEHFRSDTWRTDLSECLGTARFASIINQEYLHWRIQDHAERISPQRKWLSAEQVHDLEEVESHWTDSYLKNKLYRFRKWRESSRHSSNG